MGEVGDTYKHFVRKPDRWGPLEELGADWRIILSGFYEILWEDMNWIHLT
jgi:hypothetical protein